MKKITSLLLILCLLLSLGACGKKDVPGVTVPVQNIPAATAPKETTGEFVDIQTVETSPWVDIETVIPETEPPFVDIKPVNNSVGSFDYNSVPAYSGKGYYVVNNNEPYFTDEDKTRLDAFEDYSPLDSLGRCGVAYANICQDLMPTEKRGDISAVHPSGWDYQKKSNNNKYSGLVGGGETIYNRCHLIGYQLAGENANKLNLVTGTTYMNHNDGMLQFENMIDDWVDEENGHCLYRVTPIFVKDELVCRGVLMEAWSVEDDGDSICFNVFCYNVQPGYEIDYHTGQNWPAGEGQTITVENVKTYILNTNSHKFHTEDCSSAAKMSEKNKEIRQTSRESLINAGYEPCGYCNP